MSDHDTPHPLHEDPADPRLKGIDYDETVNVQRIHEPILREKVEPQEGDEPMPLWLIGVILAVVLWGGYYLGQYNGGWSGTGFDEKAGTAAAGGAIATATAAAADENSPEALAKLGKRVYTTNCASCHTPTGLGVAGQYPPLAASEWVLDRPYHVVALILHGLQGPIVVKGNTYNNAMAAWQKQLNDRQIAAVATYIRSEWGNQAGPITPAQVAAIRKETEARTEPYNAADIAKLPTDLPVIP
jgi:mono/diheme cytochrome c family protein